MIDPVLLDLPTSIATERLLLRPPRAGDGPLLLAAIAETLPELRRFLGSLPWVAAEQTVESSELYCRNAEANFIARRDLPFLLFEKVTGELVGACGLHRIAWATPKVEVGYWGRVSRAGNGFISEAVEALVGYAFDHLHAARVELITDEANEASRRLAERCRFRLEAVLRHERRAPAGDLRNTCIYARFPAVTIRDLRPAEAEALGRLMVEVYASLEGFPTPAEQPHYYELLANIGRFTEKPGARVLVAVSPEGDLVGGIVYFGDMAEYGAGGIAAAVKNASGIRLLGVDPRHRGAGAGRALARACIQLARADGHSQVVLHTTQAMRAAWRLYEKLGFGRSEDLDFSQQGLAVFGFRLKLAP